MAKVIPIGEPVNDAERRAIAHLRDSLPNSYRVLHNFEVVRNGEYFEVDIAVVAPHAVYLVDVKGHTRTHRRLRAQVVPGRTPAVHIPAAEAPRSRAEHQGRHHGEPAEPPRPRWHLRRGCVSS